MRRKIGILSLLAICLLCHCKKPAPPDDMRMARSEVSAGEYQPL